MREKLIDDVHSELMGLLQRTPYIRCEDVNRQYAVNWLMNNGVTVQKWIPVTERLPETTCRNMVTKYGIPFLAYYTGKEWRESGTLSVVDGITHWMPLPEPPKEDV